MAKPWARLEQNYINHPKFLALSPAAICLWHEGKNYCDMHQTDGLIPREALKTFRFASRSSVDALLASPGDKPDGSPWAPLWERTLTLGFKMHDYLDHNDCRDAVLARIEDAEDMKAIRNQQNAGRQRAYRAKRKADLKSNAESNAVTRNALRHGNVTNNVTCSTPTETETETETPVPKKQEQGPTASRSKWPIFKGQRLVVFDWMLDDLRRMLGSNTDAFALDDWFFTLDEEARKLDIVIPQRDGGKWLYERTLEEAVRRGLPLVVAHTAQELKRAAGTAKLDAWSRS